MTPETPPTPLPAAGRATVERGRTSLRKASAPPSFSVPQSVLLSLTLCVHLCLCSFLSCPGGSSVSPTLAFIHLCHFLSLDPSPEVPVCLSRPCSPLPHLPSALPSLLGYSLSERKPIPSAPKPQPSKALGRRGLWTQARPPGAKHGSNQQLPQSSGLATPSSGLLNVFLSNASHMQ